MIPGTIPEPARRADEAFPRDRPPAPGLPLARRPVGPHVLSGRGPEGRSRPVRLTVPVDPGGLIAGVVGPQRQPLVLRPFQGRPVFMVLVSGLSLAQLVAMRAVALGAQVVVATARPQAWVDLSGAAAGRDDVAVTMLGEPVERRPSPSRPLLEIHDGGPVPRLVPGDGRPWHTVAVLLPFLAGGPAGQGDAATPLLERADLVAAQRLSDVEAGILAAALDLGPTEQEALPRLPDELALWHAGGTTVVAHTSPTGIETGVIGAASGGAVRG